MSLVKYWCQIKNTQIIFQNWHKRCFACSNCNRHLDSTTVNDGTDGDIYCRTCYSAKFGLKGYGFGQGAGTLMSVCIVEAPA